MSTSKLNGDIFRDTPEISRRNDALSLGAGVAETYTVPAGVNNLVIAYTAGTLWCNPDATAAVPASDITDGSASFLVLQGDMVNVDEGETLSFINATACIVSLQTRRAF